MGIIGTWKQKRKVRKEEGRARDAKAGGASSQKRTTSNERSATKDESDVNAIVGYADEYGYKR